MKNTKILSTVLLVLSLCALVMTILVYSARENEKAKRVIVEQENAVILTQKDALTEEIAALKDNEQKLNRKYSQLMKKKNDLENAQTRLKSDADKAVRKSSTLEKRLQEAKKEYADYKAKTADIIKDFKNKNEDLVKRIETLQNQLQGTHLPVGGQSSGSVLTNMSQMQGRTMTSSPSVQLPKVVVNAQVASTGKVVVVNKKYNFFISNLGRKDGLKIGDMVSVFRNNMMIAEGAVEKLYDNLSASGITSANNNFSIQEGDIVKVR